MNQTLPGETVWLVDDLLQPDNELQHLLGNAKLVSEPMLQGTCTQQLPRTKVGRDTVSLVEVPSQPSDSKQQLPSITVRLIEQKSYKNEETTLSTKSQKLQMPISETQWNNLLQLWSKTDSLVQEILAQAKEDPTQDKL